MLSRYNCLLFDVDGTLLDFEAAEQEAIIHTLEKAGLPSDENVTAQFSSINASLWAQLEKGEIKKEKLVVLRFQKLLEALGATGDAVLLNNEFMTRMSEAAPLIPGADELLAELAEFATLAVCSNALYKVQIPRLEKAGILQYFDEIFVSEKLGVTKPSPKFFELALHRLGVKNKARALVIGDSLTADIAGGQKAGIDTCWCNFKDAPAPATITPTYTVHSYAELKLAAVGEEALKIAATREKRHTV